jgi:hypothetical protein
VVVTHSNPGSQVSSALRCTSTSTAREYSIVVDEIEELGFSSATGLPFNFPSCSSTARPRVKSRLLQPLIACRAQYPPNPPHIYSLPRLSPSVNNACESLHGWCSEPPRTGRRTAGHLASRRRGIPTALKSSQRQLESISVTGNTSNRCEVATVRGYSATVAYLQGRGSGGKRDLLSKITRREVRGVIGERPGITTSNTFAHMPSTR